MRETMSDRGPWIAVGGGRRFYLLDPRPEDVFIEDIAEALSNQTRFNGHFGFYSVAQHSVLVSEQLPGPMKLQGLMHDAAETYIGDIVRPVKAAIGDRVRAIEDPIMWAVCKRFSVTWPFPRDVKRADNNMVLTEARSFGLDTSDWGVEGTALDRRIIPLPAMFAEEMFLHEFRRLSRKKTQRAQRTATETDEAGETTTATAGLCESKRLRRLEMELDGVDRDRETATAEAGETATETDGEARQ